MFEWGGEREHWQALLEQRSAGVPGDEEPSCRRGQRQISRLPALLGKVPRGIHWVEGGEVVMVSRSQTLPIAPDTSHEL